MVNVMPCRITQTSKTALVWLLIVVAFALFFNLGGWGVTETSEARYAEISWEMFQSGDYLHPRLLGIQHFHKPPVVYWITAMAYHLFGPSAFAARFFLQIALLIQLWLIYHLTVLLFNEKKTALLAALIYTSFIGVILSTRVLTTDAFLNTWGLAAIFFWAKRRRTGEWGWLYAAWFCLGMGFMTKGPVAFIVPVIVFPAMNHLLPLENRGQFWHQFGGIALFLLVALPWYLYLVWENPDFLNYFVIDHTVNRFATNQFKRGEPFWFFLAALPVLSFPWLLVSIRRFKWSLRKPFRATQMLWLWILVPLFFFSLSHSKLVLYILPIFPAVAILGANAWQQMLMKSQKRWNGTLLAYHLIVLGALVVVPFVMKGELHFTWPMWCIILVIAALVGYQVYNFSQPHRGLWVAALFSLSVTVLSTFFLGANPVISNDPRDVAQFVQAQLPSHGRIMVFNKRLPSMAFNTGQLTLSIEAGDKSLDRETGFEVDKRWTEFFIEADSLLLKKDEFFTSSVLVAPEDEKDNAYLLNLAQHYSEEAVVGEWMIFFEAIP